MRPAKAIQVSFRIILSFGSEHTFMQYSYPVSSIVKGDIKQTAR